MTQTAVHIADIPVGLPTGSDIALSTAEDPPADPSHRTLLQRHSLKGQRTDHLRKATGRDLQKEPSRPLDPQLCRTTP
jgi:hypothetical protein